MNMTQLVLIMTCCAVSLDYPFLITPSENSKVYLLTDISQFDNMAT